MSIRAAMLCVWGLVPVVSLGEEAAAPPPPPEGVWTGKGQAGYVSAQGNSEAKSANAMLDMGLVEGPWKHAFHLGGLYGQSAGIVSAERYDLGWQTNYALTQDLYTFGALRYQHDLYSGFDYQASATVGLGYQLIDTDRTKLSAQVGVGYRELKPEELTKNAAGEVTMRVLEEKQSGAVGTAGVNYSQALTSTTTLSDKLLIESGSSDTLVTNALAVAVKISTQFALSVGYSIQDNTKPPSTQKKLDTLETVNLVYAF